MASFYVEEENQDTMFIEPYRFEPIKKSDNLASDEESDESVGENRDIIPDENTIRLGNTEWYVYFFIFSVL